MPPKKIVVAKKGKEVRASEVDDDNVDFLDVQYNPSLVDSLLVDLKAQIDAKCNQIQNDSDFMVTSIQQAFHLEKIKLPTQIKKMPMAKFKQEYGSIFEAMKQGVMKSQTSAAVASSSLASNKIRNSYNENINSSNNNSSIYDSAVKSKPNSHSNSVYQTPSSNKYIPQTPGTVRRPQEGEVIVSANGSPLGVFNTVVKAKPDKSSFVPATPGVYVPLENGDVLDIEEINIDEDQFSKLSRDNKLDALNKMQAMMMNMQKLMEKLGKSAEATL